MAFNFNALVDEFKRTNWQEPGTWHVAPKLLVLLAIVVGIPVAAFFADTQSQIEELENGRNQETKLKEEYLGKKKQAINLDLHRQQLREIDTQFGALLRQLPNRSQMDALLVDINQAGLGRGLQFELFKPAPSETVREFYGAADPGEGRRQLPRHGRLRERRGAAVAHRHVERRVDPGRQGRHSHHGCRGEDLPLPRRRGSGGAAQVGGGEERAVDEP